MQPKDVLHAVRKGYALATPRQVEMVKPCRDVEMIERAWVPRWALEAEAALERAGYEAARIREIFAQGHEAVLSELTLLVREGKRPRLVESRRRGSLLGIDRRTETALRVALRQHRAACSHCAAGEPCLEAGEINDQLELLFPPERRKKSRS